MEALRQVISPIGSENAPGDDTVRPAPSGASASKLENSDGLLALEGRVGAIEGRLPEKATLEQVATANEARLSVLVEHLERDLVELRGKTLNRGDVILTVFATLAGFGVVVALLTAAIRFAVMQFAG
jgi:hypothetical protein